MTKLVAGLVVVVAAALAASYCGADAPSDRPDGVDTRPQGGLVGALEPMAGPSADATPVRPLVLPPSPSRGDGIVSRGAAAVSIFDTTTNAVLVSGVWSFEPLAGGSAETVVVDLADTADGVVPLPAGTWRAVHAGLRWIVEPREFALEPAEERILLASPVGSYQVLVTDEHGVGLAGVPVLSTPERCELWSAYPPWWEMATGVACQVRLTDASGFAFLQVTCPGPTILSAAQPGRGVVNRRILPQPGLAHELTLPLLGEAMGLRVIDSRTGSPIEQAVLNDTIGALGSLSDSDGQLEYWGDESTATHWVLSAPGYVPRRVDPREALTTPELRLNLQALLHWTYAPAPSAAPGDPPPQLVVGIAPILVRSGSFLYVREWEQSGTLSGTFVVPFGMTVHLTAILGGATTSVDEDVVSLEQHVTLRGSSPATTLTLESLLEDASHRRAVVHYRDFSHLSVPFTGRIAVIPRPAGARHILVPYRTGFLTLYRDDGSSVAADEGTISLTAPKTSPQTFLLRDASGKPARGVLLELADSKAVALAIRSSHPAWRPEYYEPTPDSGAASAAGVFTWDLPPAEYRYRIRHISSGEILGEGKLLVGSEPATHTIVAHALRWARVRARWADGRDVARFEVRYELPWARKPGSPWALRIGRGAHGWCQGWLPAASIRLSIQAPGAQEAVYTMGAEESQVSITLFHRMEEVSIELLNLDASIEGAMLTTFSLGGNYIESMYIKRAESGRFVVANPHALKDRLSMLVIEVEAGSLESRLLRYDELTSVPVELRLTPD